MDEYEGLRKFGREVDKLAGKAREMRASSEVEKMKCGPDGRQSASHERGMTGIERLRGVAGFWRENRLDDIVEQIEREQCGHVSRMRVLAVITDMERHVSGAEGMEDSPVARWARELRDALGGDGRDPAADTTVDAYDLLPQEDREAITWVRAHGGLGAVTIEHSNLWSTVNETRRRLGVERAGDLTADAQAIWRKVDRLKSLLGDSVPRAAYERHLERRQRQVDESHAALRRRSGRIAVLERERDEGRETIRGLRALLADVIRGVQAQCEAFGVDVSGCETASDMLHDMNEALSFRLMPEGMEWPRFEGGEPVRIGGEFASRDDGEVFAVRAFTIDDDSFDIISDEFSEPYNMGERVKRPAPKVLDADGTELRKGDAVWDTRNGDALVVRAIEDDGRTISCRYVDVDDDAIPVHGMWSPSCITHRAPVLAADGRPLREGEHVWHVETGAELVVKELPKPGAYQAVVVFAPPASHLTSFDPDQLTHERPDSWERLEEDADLTPVHYAKKYANQRHDSNAEFQRKDLVRRAKALAERGQ